MSAPIAINAPHSASSASSSPSSPGLYVPIHKRAASSTSRPSSPSGTPSPNTSLPPYVYSAATLLSLQPFADESMKAKMCVTCPEVVMTRKTRKGLEVHGRRAELLAAQQQLLPPPLMPTFQAPSPPAALRVVPRRTRPAGRTQERRRNAIASPFGSRRTGEDSWRLQAAPLSPILLV